MTFLSSFICQTSFRPELHISFSKHAPSNCQKKKKNAPHSKKITTTINHTVFKEQSSESPVLHFESAAEERAATVTRHVFPLPQSRSTRRARTSVRIGHRRHAKRVHGSISAESSGSVELLMRTGLARRLVT